jgi:hypothetical protein
VAAHAVYGPQQCRHRRRALAASEYDEEYVRVEGTWKFKTLRLDVKYYVPQLQDWALASIGNRIP